MISGVQVEKKWYGDQVKAEMERALQESLGDAGELLQERMTARITERTGRAKGSITWATSTARSRVRAPAKAKDQIDAPKKKGVLHVGSALWRMRFLEHGTVRMAAQPSIRPAFDESRTQVLGIVERRTRKVVS